MRRVFSRRMQDNAVIYLHYRPMLTVQGAFGNRLGWLHATSSGAPVLRSEASWRTISGVIVVLPKSTLFIQFRRWIRWRSS